MLHRNLFIILLTFACGTKNSNYVPNTPIHDPTSCNNKSYELVNNKDLYISTFEDTVWTDSETGRRLSVIFSRFDGKSNSTYSNGSKVYWRILFEDSTEFQSIIRSKTIVNIELENGDEVELPTKTDSDFHVVRENLQHFLVTPLTDDNILILSNSNLKKIELKLEYKNLIFNFENSDYIIQGLKCIQKI